MSLADGMPEAAEFAEDGSNAEPAKSADELLPCVRRGPFAVGFWYEIDALALPTPVAARLGSPLETNEATMIEQISRASSAGESFSLGLLGGRGAVGVDMVASKATLYAPPAGPVLR
jgi:hypothetical protein